MTASALVVDDRAVATLTDATVWVSGGHGFIGTRLVEALRLHGARPVLFDGDIADADAVTASIADAAPALLYNLAAPVNVARNPALAELMRTTLLDGALAVHAAAAATGLRPLLVQVGTCEEYGTIEAPFAESDEPSEPVSPYSRFKLEATRTLLRLAADDPRVRVVVARPFLTYGPGQNRPMLVPAAIGAALAGVPFPMTAGLQTRELNYVDDTAMGLLRIAGVPALEGTIINVAGGDERRVVDIASLIFEIAEAPDGLLRPGALPHRGGEVPRFFADTTRCRDVLGHTPRIDLAEGLRRTIDAHRAAAASETA
ncbi:MAG: NAD(P)-dependent oxidoreductase [Proteobacteria bacterium]|nr:NAD(P)-dependent oxidoreductase [Pseudomonadota bacterium]